MRSVTTWAFAAMTALPLAFLAGNASAAPTREACGNLELVAIGECHFEVEGGCKAKCEPLNLVAACDGQCNATVTTECTSSCNVDCQAQCEVDPAKFECKSSCVTDCNANIQTRCPADDQDCINYCEADCESNCDAQCSVVAAEADCVAQCEGCCGGSCETDANFDCSLDCSVDLQGGCEVACDKPEGALFCDGQYIDIQNIDDCIQYLNENYELTLEVKAEASASVSCAASNGGSSTGALVLLGAAASLAAARRRKNRKTQL
ncbi:MAG: hypothetical protein IPK82_36600 [Polyangiaceae bacterium]|nr:hypothetical protein [Polyangiaceae bacterium]